LLCPGQSCVINIGNHQQRRSSVTVDDIIDSCESHGSHSCKNRHSSSLADSHVMLILSSCGMIHSMEGSCHAGQRLCQGTAEITFPGVMKQAAHLHDLIGNDNISGI